MHADGDRQAVEEVLSKDMAIIEYLPDLEAKAQHYKNGVGSLLIPPKQQGSETWDESQLQ